MGLLIRDSEVTKENILRTMPNDAFLITVGDATTEKMIKFGLAPSLQIVDSLEKRHERNLPLGKIRTTLECVNPAAEITNESIETIKKAFHADAPVRIIVKGEEDLLVLPAALYAPENAVIMYGQPNEGLVVMKVTEQIRNTAIKIMDSMS
ncbi:MAG: GTP-dependent dephospho-CoA kinase family protein [Thaumarchaeota archaeon]|nr:GTP-dependent dephospho-CoA kinase family protein [Nitrososphaerota archaeon]